MKFLAPVVLCFVVVSSLDLEDPVLPEPIHFRNQVLRMRRQTSRIINGDDASVGEFPHQATLLLDSAHLCGASIIANGWALTAAHCVDGRSISQLAIVTDLHDFNNPGNYQWFDLERVTMHASYNRGSGTYPNDIAVLKLYLEGRDTSKNAISVASSSNQFAGERCVISGWGQTESGGLSQVLQKATVTVLTNGECNERWVVDGGDIVDSHICVMGTDTSAGTGSCSGDSGGPLVCGGQLAGATSWGVSGCHSNGRVTHPSVYTRVSFFYSWIRSNCDNCV